MKSRRARAVELLMSNQPVQVAEMVGVRVETLERWMDMVDFKEALASSEKMQKKSLAMLSRQAAVNAAETLCEIASDRTKPDAKILLEIVKAAGGFNQEEDNGEGIIEVLRAARMEALNA